jgi:GNAT superfamily N-acetyltransferase
MEIKQAVDKEDYLKCWEVVRELRPHLNQEEYLTLMLYMIDEGYKMIYIEEGGKGLSFCGYRHVTMLHRGRSIYIDDLCTLPVARGKGHAAMLLQYVMDEAKKEEMQSIHLDSGHQRHTAHRLYLNQGFIITSHHFALNLSANEPKAPKPAVPDPAKS